MDQYFDGFSEYFPLDGMLNLTDLLDLIFSSDNILLKASISS